MTIGLGIFYFILFCIIIWVFTLIEKVLGWVYDNSNVGRTAIQAYATISTAKAIKRFVDKD